MTGSAAKAVIGLTGGIASGKSCVARILSEHGVSVIDADRVAREVVDKGTDGLRDIVARFGAGLLTADGALDRDKLAKIVFSDPEARAALNAITHPRIGQRSAELISAAQASAAPYVAYEAALLVETGIYKGLSALVVVSAPQHLQRERASARDNTTISAVDARIRSQLPLADKVAVADYVIENDGDLDALRARTLNVHEQLLERFGAGEPREAR